MDELRRNKKYTTDKEYYICSSLNLFMYIPALVNIVIWR